MIVCVFVVYCCYLQFILCEPLLTIVFRFRAAQQALRLPRGGGSGVGASLDTII